MSGLRICNGVMARKELNGISAPSIYSLSLTVVKLLPYTSAIVVGGGQQLLHFIVFAVSAVVLS
jgi:hypothetical protein